MVHASRHLSCCNEVQGLEEEVLIETEPIKRQRYCEPYWGECEAKAEEFVPPLPSRWPIVRIRRSATQGRQEVMMRDVAQKEVLLLRGNGLREAECWLVKRMYGGQSHQMQHVCFRGGEDILGWSVELASVMWRKQSVPAGNPQSPTTSSLPVGDLHEDDFDQNFGQGLKEHVGFEWDTVNSNYVVKISCCTSTFNHRSCILLLIPVQQLLVLLDSLTLFVGIVGGKALAGYDVVLTEPWRSHLGPLSLDTMALMFVLGGNGMEDYRLLLQLVRGARVEEDEA
ncbi:hypothetical protein BDQ17DRAFT_1335308 [Cyathus striatus]|nr:hypothetical protein BDQ17DRAFT_1335308 [Cyathus striatus]